jgi:cellulose biosynthesis protein BcsQ
MPKVIGVVQLKGRVGKTTLSINLAAALSGRRKVGVLDVDG